MLEQQQRIRPGARYALRRQSLLQVPCRNVRHQPKAPHGQGLEGRGCRRAVHAGDYLISLLRPRLEMVWPSELIKLSIGCSTLTKTMMPTATTTRNSTRISVSSEKMYVCTDSSVRRI